MTRCSRLHELLYVQAGIVYRSLLKFDVSFIPRGSTVHLAELQTATRPRRPRS